MNVVEAFKDDFEFTRVYLESHRFDQAFFMQESVNICLHAGKNQRGKHESKEDRKNLYKKGL